MRKKSIYQQAVNNGCQFVAACTGITIDKWNELMKGARQANKKKVVRIALLAGVIDKQQATREIKEPWYNPYSHHVTRTHIIYVHSGIEHFIEVRRN